VDAPLGHFLLYIYRFREAQAEGTRNAFFEFIKVLDTIRTTGADDLELLIAFHHTSDCGLILTGSTQVADSPEGELMSEDLELSWVDEEAPTPDRLEEALVLVRRGLFDEALERFVAAYTEQHYQRTAYLGAAVIGDILGRDDEAATAAIMGTRYFPGDPALQYHKALIRLRAGDHAGAQRALGPCLEWAHGQASVALLSGIMALDSGQLSIGERLLERIEPRDFRTDSHLVQARKWLLAQLAARRVLRFLGAAGMAVTLAYAVLAWLAAAPYAAALSLGGAVTFLFLRTGAHRAWRRQLTRQLRSSNGRRMNLTSTGVLHKTPGGEPAQ